jgi:mono/diheme cytochrome c family protein
MPPPPVRGTRVLVPWLAAAAILWSARAAAAPTRTGRDLYEASCASCHGVDGTGGAAVAAGFPLAPPDFTDCSFASREPDSDWLSVAHQGGPARGFDRVMPAFGQALTLDELRLVLGHVRTFCREPAWPRGELNLPRAQVTSKAYPEDEAALRVIASEREVITRLVYARRLGARAQLEVIAPFVYAEQADGAWSGGIGDVAVSAKRVLGHSLARGAIVSGAVEIVTPTGRTDRGVGAGTTVFEGYLAYGQLLPARTFVQLQIGGGVPYDRDVPDEVFARGVLGWRVAPTWFGRVWSPMVEVVSARGVVDGASTHVDVVPELQVTLSTRQHVVANLGVRIPVTEREGRVTQVLAYVIWDWFDGGFLEGW